MHTFRKLPKISPNTKAVMPKKRSIPRQFRNFPDYMSQLTKIGAGAHLRGTWLPATKTGFADCTYGFTPLFVAAKRFPNWPVRISQTIRKSLMNDHQGW